MTEYANRPGGMLWVNDYKTSERHPDFKGKLTLDNEVFLHLFGLYKAGQPLTMEVAAWTKTATNGSKGISVSTSVPRARAGVGAVPNRAAAPKPAFDADLDDDIPF